MPALKVTRGFAEQSRARAAVRLAVRCSRYCSPTCKGSANAAQKRERRRSGTASRQPDVGRRVRDLVTELARLYGTARGVLAPAVEGKLAELADLVL